MKKNNIKYDVYMSYRRRDGGWQIARLIYEGLKSEGIKPFIDMESMTFGGLWRDQIKEAIMQCKYVVIVLTKNSLDRCISDPSDWLLHELQFAKKLKKPICPIYAQDFKFPKQLPKSIEFIATMHGLLINEWNWEDVISHVANAVEKEKTKIIREKMNMDDNSLYPLFIRKGIYYIIDFSEKKTNLTLLKKYKQCIIDTFGVGSSSIKILHIDLAKQTIKPITFKEKK